MSKKTKTAKKPSFKFRLVKLLIVCGAIAVVFSLGYQLVRKPGEIYNLFVEEEHKMPKQTWQSYGSSFKSHQTSLIEAEFLAALAQVESAGRAMAAPPWEFSWDKLFSKNFYKAFAPMTSAFGIMQITDGFYQRAKNYCVKDQKVVRRGTWSDFKSCWFNWTYFRGVPSHSIEMTSAFLHTELRRLKRAYKVSLKGLKRVKWTGAIHLCGLNRVRRWMARYGAIPEGARCGAHSVKNYISKLTRYYKTFRRIEREEKANIQLVAGD